MSNWRKKFAAAFNGLNLALKDRSFLIHLPSAAAAIAAGLYFQVTAVEWCLLALAIASVLAMELMNTAVEQLARIVTREPHPLIGAALDLAAAAVFLTACGAFAVGLFVFVPYVWQGWSGL